ncbi:RNA-binding S4 domain-containing protein [Dysgonomonas massiliensis]|uniref:RNA-binding S4 domain-containing protein n=1 Tax=Dysgonomonas massiliensis TaxID=2040292 RepID=UPI000C77C6CF|nr:RNA-binding S4 domain-containing protein [Dysgonomonas massiliensis]
MAAGDKEVRIDKWLWAVRLFKTRSIAIEACKKGRISIKGVQVKASRMIKVGDIIEIRKPPITYSFEVLDLIERRVGAKLAADYRKDVTTPEQLEVLEMSKLSGFVDRARGTGRPTKKDRRELETFIEDGGFDFDFDFDDED